MSQANLVITPMRPSDMNFVAKALKEGLRHSEYKDLSNWEAYRIVNPTINDLLSKVHVLVARRDKRELGFVVYDDVDGIALCHVYVRGDARREGVGRQLLLAFFDAIDPESTHESFFPTERWREKAESYGFFVPPSKETAK